MTTHRCTSDPTQLVASFAGSKDRFQIYTALQAVGRDALAAVREGLKHENWHVRHWCAIYLDRHGDAESLQSLLPLLRDPVARVRLWAVHALSCQHCKDYACPIDVVPLLLDRIENDASTRVRKMAIAMLADSPPDPRVVPIFKAVLEKEHDARLRLHAARGLRKYREAGMNTSL